MPGSSFNHGVRLLDVGGGMRGLDLANVTSIGAVIYAPDADASVFPPDEPVAIYTHDAAAVAALGDGTGRDIVNAIRAQGIDARLVIVRVAPTPAADELTTEEIRAALVGSAALNTGVHALAYARGHVGVEPGILISPGYSAGRVDSAKNPLADALEQVARKLRAIAVLDTGGPDEASSLAYRADFSDRHTYLVDPFVRVLDGTEIVAKPASPYVAAAFIKKDLARGGPYFSPSNQDIAGILGTARPISYFEGETEHEANTLNAAGIATFIPARLAQGAGGGFAPNGRILWGNRTTSDDPNWRFVNAVRIRSLIEKTMVRGFRWANDENISAQQVIAIIRTTQDLLDRLRTAGAILGGRAFYDGEQNTTGTLKVGKLRVEFDYEPAPPLEDLIFGAHRNDAYFDDLATSIQRAASLSLDASSFDLI